MLIFKVNVNVEANRVDLDQADTVRALRSGSPVFNQMVQVYTVQPRSHSAEIYYDKYIVKGDQIMNYIHFPSLLSTHDLHHVPLELGIFSARHFKVVLGMFLSFFFH